PIGYVLPGSSVPATGTALWPALGVAVWTLGAPEPPHAAVNSASIAVKASKVCLTPGLRATCCGGCRRDGAAIFPQRRHLPAGADVGERIALHRHQVGARARPDPSDVVAPDDIRGDARRGCESALRRHADLDERLELRAETLGVVERRSGVGPGGDCDAGAN